MIEVNQQSRLSSYNQWGKTHTAQEKEKKEGGRQRWWHMGGEEKVGEKVTERHLEKVKNTERESWGGEWVRWSNRSCHLISGDDITADSSFGPLLLLRHSSVNRAATGQSLTAESGEPLLCRQ